MNSGESVVATLTLDKKEDVFYLYNVWLNREIQQKRIAYFQRKTK
jgi:hypothetical protein